MSQLKNHLHVYRCKACETTELHIDGEPNALVYAGEKPCNPGCSDTDLYIIPESLAVVIRNERRDISTAPSDDEGDNRSPHPAPAFLEAGAQHMRDRAEQRDTPGGERSMAKAVNAFNTMYGFDLSEEEGWQFMVLLKMSRASSGAYVQDDYEDQAAYSGLAGEAASRDRQA